jgi:uncharacterized membrane protein
MAWATPGMTTSSRTSRALLSVGRLGHPLDRVKITFGGGGRHRADVKRQQLVTVDQARLRCPPARSAGQFACVAILLVAHDPTALRWPATYLAAVLTSRPPASTPSSVVDDTTVDDVMELVVRGFEIAGVGCWCLARWSPSFTRALSHGARVHRGPTSAHDEGLGRAILLGLELLIIADIALAITVDTTLKSALALGPVAGACGGAPRLIVLIRTFPSFSREVELEGKLPWRRAEPKKRGVNERT